MQSSALSEPIGFDVRPGRRTRGLHDASVDAPWRTMSLVRADPSFLTAVPAEDRRLAERALTAVRHDLTAGRWDPETLVPAGGQRPLAALILEGVICHEVHLGGRVSTQLLGPGDYFRPWQEVDTALPCSTTWACAGNVSVGVLDDRFLTAARRWPHLVGLVYDRLNDQLDNAARRAAMCGLSRVDDRVLALFWYLADRWGIVRPEGIVIDFPLTHELIGRLIGAKRPTVSLALSALAAENFLKRDQAGAWTLSHESVAALVR
jgi:CRP-like cAMP-binding protein